MLNTLMRNRRILIGLAALIVSVAGFVVLRQTIACTLFLNSSPRGLVAYEGEGRLWVASADGGQRCPVAAGEFELLSWSPGGTQLAFLRFAQGMASYSIHVMNSNGSGLRQVGMNGSAFPKLSSPAWRPNAAELAFMNETSNIATVNLTDGATRVLTDAVQAGLPTWSPDGTQIAYARGLEDPVRGLFVMNADGSGSRQLADDNNVIVAHVWSPDGAWIAYGSSGQEAVVIRADGSERRGFWPSIDGFERIEAVQWFPDSQRLLVTAQRTGDSGSLVWSALVVDVEAGTVVPLETPDSTSTFYTLAPDGGSLLYLMRAPSTGDEAQLASLDLASGHKVYYGEGWIPAVQPG